jgi:4-hydroxy-3-methylbut-2-enyl diphosphate reductase
VVLVVGARNSSNSNRLREVAAQCGVPAYLIEEASELEPEWLRGADRIGVTAGASAPEILVTALRERLVELGAGSERQLPGVREAVTFRLPQLDPRKFDSALAPARSAPASPSGASGLRPMAARSRVRAHVLKYLILVPCSG